MIGQRLEVPIEYVVTPERWMEIAGELHPVKAAVGDGCWAWLCRCRRAGLNTGNRIVEVIGEGLRTNQRGLEVIGSGRVLYWVACVEGKKGETLVVGSDELLSWPVIAVTADGGRNGEEEPVCRNRLDVGGRFQGR